MGKALMVAQEGASCGSGVERTIPGGRFGNSVESQSQYSATEDCVLSNMRTRIASGNSGTATFRLRDSGANGAQTFAITGVGANEDAVNTDTLTAGDTLCLGYTDTGTNAVVDFVAMNVAMASGHGCFHCACGASFPSGTIDVASITRYWPIQGEINADGQTSAAVVAWKVYGYTSVEAIQVRVTANARTNDTTFRLNVNGSPAGSTITFAAAATGLQTATGMALALSPGDTVCMQHTTGTGTEAITVSFIGATLKSTGNASEIFACNTGGVGRTASATASYYLPGSALIQNETTETTERVKPGFAARCADLRANIESNTYSASCTLSLMVNGVAQITKTIAAGATGWQENNSDTFDIDDNDEISFEIVGGTSGSLAWSGLGITMEEIPAGGAIVGKGLLDSPLLRPRRLAA